MNPDKDTFNFILTSDEAWRKKYQNIRVMERDRLYITGDTTIYNNTFAVCYWKQGEVVGVEIENPEYVRTQKSIFEEMWKLSDPIEKYIK